MAFAGALGIERPDADLVVSPQHRMVLNGRAAQALFNTEEVLVKRGELIDERRADLINTSGIASIRIRSPLTCDAEEGVCALCYAVHVARLARLPGRSFLLNWKPAGAVS